jgi:hypothetical protein
MKISSSFLASGRLLLFLPFPLLFYSPLHFLSLLFNAITFHVLSPAFVAELVTASTSHMIAPLIFFDPKFAFGAHLELFALHKLFKFNIILVFCIRHLIFFAALPFMKNHPAIQAIPRIII